MEQLEKIKERTFLKTYYNFLLNNRYERIKRAARDNGKTENIYSSNSKTKTL